MIDLKAPPRKGFSQSRGRPKNKTHSDDIPSFLITKRESFRKKIGIQDDKECLTWLDICLKQQIISKELFEIGKLYTKIRILAIHSQGIMRFKSSSYLLIRHELKSPSFHNEQQREQAERLWKKIARRLSPSTRRDLDALLLQPVSYELSETDYNLCKRRLKTSLEEVYLYLNQ